MADKVESVNRFLNKRRLVAYGIIFAIAGLVLLDAFYIEPSWVEVSYHNLKSGSVSGNIRIVHLTDLHLDDDTRLDFVPDLVSSLEPDIILITGDFANYIYFETSENAMLARISMYLNRLDAPLGVYASFGNWDEGYEGRVLDGTHVVSLRDENIRIGNGAGIMTLTGLDHSWDYGYAAHGMEKLSKDVDEDYFNILLYHSPDIIDETAQTGKFDLYLTGHTHGGQVRVPFLDAIRFGFRKAFPYPGSLKTFSRHGAKYDAGMYRIGETRMYVSRGVGTEGGVLPVRFFCRPEIAVIDIVPYDS